MNFKTNKTKLIARVMLFILIVWATKYLSLGSVICELAMPLILNNLEKEMPFHGYFAIIRLLLSFVIAGIVVYKHRANITRIMNKTESKFSFKKTKKKSDIEAEQQALQSEDDMEEELTPEVLARKEANRKKSAKKKK